MYKDAHEVDGDEDDDVGGDCLPLGHELEVGVEDDHGDHRVETGQQEAVGHGQPGPVMSLITTTIHHVFKLH